MVNQMCEEAGGVMPGRQKARVEAAARAASGALIVPPGCLVASFGQRTRLGILGLNCQPGTHNSLAVGCVNVALRVWRPPDGCVVG